MDRERLPALVQEDDVEWESHAKGVNAPAARDQQARPCSLSAEKRESKEPGAEADCHRHLPTQDRGGRETIEPPGAGWPCHGG